MRAVITKFLIGQQQASLLICAAERCDTVMQPCTLRYLSRHLTVCIHRISPQCIMTLCMGNLFSLKAFLLNTELQGERIYRIKEGLTACGLSSVFETTLKLECSQNTAVTTPHFEEQYLKDDTRRATSEVPSVVFYP